MIKINLATRKQAAYLETGGKQKISFDFDKLKEYPILKIGGVLIVVFVVNHFLDSYKEKELAAVKLQMTQLDQKQVRIQNQINQKKTLERSKDLIEADELMMKTKIETINTLMAGRMATSRMLVKLAEIIPSEVWFTEFKVRGEEIQLKGVSLGYNMISDLMSRLGQTTFFSNVSLKSSEASRNENGVELAMFEIVAQKRKSE